MLFRSGFPVTIGEGWAIEEDGNLVLMDECGQFAYPPDPSRFKVVFDEK